MATAMIDYAPARRAEIPRVAALFQDAFPDALRAVFGRAPIPARAVEDVWDAVYRFEPGGFLVARSSDRVVGVEVAVSDLRQLHRHLLWRGSLFVWMFRWLTGRYAGLGWQWVGRLACLIWDYRSLESPAPKDSFAQLLTIIVDKEYQCRGIGKTLTDQSLAYLKSRKVHTVRLEVDAAKIHAIRLYESAGFREIRRMPTPRGPAVVMKREL